MGGGGGGGSTDIQLRQPSQEKKTIKNWDQFQLNQLFDYIAKSPLLSAANAQSLDYSKKLPELTSPLETQYQNFPSIEPTISSLQGQFGAFPHQLSTLTGPLSGTAQGYLANVIGSQGALSKEAQNATSQLSRTMAAQYGTGRQIGSAVNEALNSQAAREARYNTALGQYNQATGQIGALDQLGQTLGTGLASSIQGMRGLDMSQRLGLAGGIQGLETGGLNQLKGVQESNVGTYTALTNPILTYLGQLFGSNLQAQVQQAQINAQANAANQNKSSGLISGGVGAIGSVAAAAF